MASGYQKMVIVGNLGQDPQQRNTASGSSMVTFSIAVNERKDGETVWFNCKAFDKIADSALQYLHRGDPVLIEARYSPREYTPEGGKKTMYPEWIVSNVRFMGKAEGSAPAEPRPTTPANRPAPAQQQRQARPAPQAADNLFDDDDAASGGGDYPF